MLQDSHLITTNTARGGTCAKGAETRLKSDPNQEVRRKCRFGESKSVVEGQV